MVIGCTITDEIKYKFAFYWDVEIFLKNFVELKLKPCKLTMT